MESPSTSEQRDNGFTLIELIIAVSLVALIATFGVLLSFDFYRSFSFLSEQRIVLSVLEKARNQAINNIDEKPHGVHFVANSCYIIFAGTYDNSGCNGTSNEVIKASPTITFPDWEVSFSQLSGNASPSGSISVGNGVRSLSIQVDSNGRIDIP